MNATADILAADRVIVAEPSSDKNDKDISDNPENPAFVEIPPDPAPVDPAPAVILPGETVVVVVEVVLEKPAAVAAVAGELLAAA